MNLHPLRAAVKRVLRFWPLFRTIEETRGTQAPVTFWIWFIQKVIGVNGEAYWPMHFTSRVGCVQNIHAGIQTAPGWSPGCYIQGLGSIHIGDYTMLAANVGIISANHDPHDHSKHIRGRVRIGKYCWIGMGAMVLPNVELGDFTVVGAGAVVTKSFPEGHCVIAGNPARLIRGLNPDDCVRYRDPHEYYGYIPAADFPAFRAKYLAV